MTAGRSQYLNEKYWPKSRVSGGEVWHVGFVHLSLPPHERGRQKLFVVTFIWKARLLAADHKRREQFQ